MNNPPFPTEALLNEIVAINNYLNAAQEILQSGHMPDLTPLEARIGELCLAIQSAPKQEKKKFELQLKLLLERLDSCEANLRGWQKKSSAG